MSLLEQLKSSYIAYSKTNAHKRKVEKAEALIQRALAEHDKPYISFSGGKDSLCLLDMVYRQKPEITVMHNDSGVELPESIGLVEKIRENWGVKVKIIKTEVDIIELFKEDFAMRGLGFDVPSQNDKIVDIAMKNPIREWQKEEGYNLNFMGLRKQESKARRALLCTKGQYFYCKQNEIWECMPLADWKKEDVWAYIFSHYPLENLIHPAYYKDRLVVDPGDIRIGWWCGRIALTTGHVLWLKIYYPDLFEKLLKEFPEVKSYV